MEEVSGPPGVPRGPRAWAPGFTRVLRPCRVSDSDDLVMTESEVGRVALRIEKELFSLFHVTDNRYKSKYRSLMFNLKDPKNQVCAHAVLSAWRGAEGSSILKCRHPSSGSRKAPGGWRGRVRPPFPALAVGLGVSWLPKVHPHSRPTSSERGCTAAFASGHQLQDKVQALCPSQCVGLSILGQFQAALSALVPFAAAGRAWPSRLPQGGHDPRGARCPDTCRHPWLRGTTHSSCGWAALLPQAPQGWPLAH